MHRQHVDVGKDRRKGTRDFDVSESAWVKQADVDEPAERSLETDVRAELRGGCGPYE